MSPFPHIRVLLLDPLGFLLLPKPPAPAETADIPAQLWRFLALSDVWGRYERGLLTDLDSVVSQLAQIPLARKWASSSSAVDLAARIRRAVDRERRNLREVPEMLEAMHLLRSGRHPHVDDDDNDGAVPLLGCDASDRSAEPESSQQYEGSQWRVVCVSNMSKDELRDLRQRFPAVFAVFDSFVISGEEGLRLPSLAFLQRAMDITSSAMDLHAKPHQTTVYYFAHASCMQSVTAARALGIHATLLSPSHNNQLRQMEIEDGDSANNCHGNVVSAVGRPMPVSAAATAVAAARNFMLTRYPTSFQFPSLTSYGVYVNDNFARFLIADLLYDSRFLPMQDVPSSSLLCFVDKTTPIYDHLMDSTKPTNHSIFNLSFMLQALPKDLDTTSIGLSTLKKFGKVSVDTINQVLDQMLAQHVCDMDGILQVYFDIHRPRIDPLVLTNVIYLFHLANRGHEVEKSEKFVQSVLFHKAYEGGTLYYELGEAFLLHISRLVHAFPNHFVKTGMKSLLVKRLQEHRIYGKRTNTKECNCLALAMYMRARLLCGLSNTQDNEHRLLQLQNVNGSWCCHSYYIYGSNRKGWFGNEGVTTSYALLTLENAL